MNLRIDGFGTRIALSKCVSYRHERRSQEAAKRRWVMAKVIEFYVPQNFKATARWVPADQRGKVVEFPSTPVRKSA
jgi:hypothetical protein